MDHGITGLMQYTFDTVPKGRGCKGEIMQIWQEMDDDPDVEKKFGFAKQDGHQFQDKKLFKPLQAADILAWHMYDHTKNVISKGLDDLANMRWTFERLRDGRPVTLAWFTKQKMKEYIEETIELQERTGIKFYGVQVRKDRTVPNAKQRIPKEVSPNGVIAKNPAQRDQSQVGSGETRENAEDIPR